MTKMSIRGRKKDISFYVDKSGCFICTSHSLNRDPTNRTLKYPTIGHKGKQWKMNRFIYQHCVGPIPHGMCVLHKCDNPICINPLHLKLGTQQENVNDMKDRGRLAVGSKIGISKLNEKDVVNIRSDKQATNKYLATQYGVSASTIASVRRMKTWKHVEKEG